MAQIRGSTLQFIPSKIREKKKEKKTPQKRHWMPHKGLKNYRNLEGSKEEQCETTTLLIHQLPLSHL